MKNNIPFIAALVFLLLLAGCGKEEAASTSEDAAAAGIKKTYDSGNGTFTLTTDKAQLSIAQTLTLTMEVVTGKEYNVKMPSFGESLSQWSIIDFHNPGQKLIDNERIKVTQVYELEPFLSGEYTIPPLRVRYWKEGDDPQNPHIIESETLTVTVTSLLEEEGASLVLKGMTPPVTPPPPDVTWIIVLAVCVLAGGGGMGFVVYRMVKKRMGMAKPVPTVPAHTIAYRQLEALIGMDLIEKGAYKLFYFGISSVVRHYIENRFSIAASGETTEEFLHDLASTERLDGETKSLITSHITREFLSRLDMVKYAAYVPETGEIQKTFDVVKEFIVSTEDPAALVPERPELYSIPVLLEEGARETTASEEEKVK